MKNQKIILIGLKLPVTAVGVFTWLVLLALTNSRIGPVIFIDKLMLVVAGLLPVICTLGAIVSIKALFKSEIKIAAFVGAVLNIVLLTVLLCFSKSFLVEFKFTILGI